MIEHHFNGLLKDELGHSNQKFCSILWTPINEILMGKIKVDKLPVKTYTFISFDKNN